MWKLQLPLSWKQIIFWRAGKEKGEKRKDFERRKCLQCRRLVESEKAPIGLFLIILRLRLSCAHFQLKRYQLGETTLNGDEEEGRRRRVPFNSVNFYGLLSTWFAWITNFVAPTEQIQPMFSYKHLLLLVRQADCLDGPTGTYSLHYGRVITKLTCLSNLSRTRISNFVCGNSTISYFIAVGRRVSAVYK